MARLRQTARESATAQSVDWISRTNRVQEAMGASQSPDAAFSSPERRASRVFATPGRPGHTTFPPPSQFDVRSKLKELAEYRGLCASLTFDEKANPLTGRPFGVHVLHHDLFDSEPEAKVKHRLSQAAGGSTARNRLLIPIQANLSPHRGLALDTLEYFGAPMARELVDKAESLIRKQKLGIGSVVDIQLANTSVNRSLPPMMESARISGVSFVVCSLRMALQAHEASIQLSYVFSQAIEKLRADPNIESLLVPFLGGGPFGFSLDSEAEHFVQDAIEGVLGLEYSTLSKLTDIVLVTNKTEEAEKLARVLEVARTEWIPSERLVSAAHFKESANLRPLFLREISEATPARQKTPYRYRKYRVRSRLPNRVFHRRHVMPFVWRNQWVLKPRSLLVREADGKPAEAQHQLSPRPYYAKLGVSHTLLESVDDAPGIQYIRRTRRTGSIVGDISAKHTRAHSRRPSIDRTHIDHLP